MCGFAGIVRLGPAPESPDVVASRMAEVLVHRGPDDSGGFGDEHVGLAFRRLSILDLAPTGHQPFVSADGRFVMVFNGEIYNYVELRAELAALGHTFRSTGDTEVLLHAYMQWGRECLPRFNGMWALLIYDRQRGTIFGSRDRFGIKPLYRAKTSGSILFGSEIKAILASGQVQRRNNQQMISEFLCRGTLTEVETGRATFFDGIEQVPPATAFELSLDGRIQEWTYWSLEAIAHTPPADPAAAFAELFDDAVRLRMRSDVPVGVSLSGGLDSTSIICAMARSQPTSPGGRGPMISSFSFMPPEFDESRYIEATVAQSRARVHRVSLDGRQMWDTIPRALWHHDEPMHSATAIIGYEIYRRASNAGVKVMLCGQGADETIGGYHSYFPDLWATLLRRGRVADTWRNIQDYAKLNGGEPSSLLKRSIERQLKLRLRRVGAYRALAAGRRKRRERQAAEWYAPELLELLPTQVGPIGRGTLDDALKYAVETAPLPLYLRIEDRNSMAHSVEARLPFLDYRLVTLDFQLPVEWRLRGGLNKFVLREAMRGPDPGSRAHARRQNGFPHAGQRMVPARAVRTNAGSAGEPVDRRARIVPNGCHSRGARSAPARRIERRTVSL